MCKQQTQSILILLRILILVTLFPHTHCESSSDTPTDSCSSSSHSNTCTNDMSATVSYIRRRIQRGEESIRRMINSYTACRSTHVILNHSTFHSTFKRYSTFTLLSSSAVAISSQPSPSSAPAASFVSRRPSLQVLSVEQSEGVGARVRRSIGRPELRNFDPFLMLDHFKATNKGGFPDHPHRGFETVTYIFPGSTGSFEHEDFVGHRGTIGPGDLQWMTAGRGILHSEMPHTSMKSGDVANGLQLWVNLPAKEKMCEPRYQELPAKDVPRVKQGGIEAHIISGTALGTTSPVYTRNPVDYFHFFLQPHTTLRQPIAKGHNSFLYTIDGPISVGEEGDAKSKEWIQPFHTVTLTNDGKEDGVTIRSGAAAANFVLLAGKPIGEPIVQHGPFVMTSQREIQEAIRDYQNGQNGFERAPGWRSEIGKPITDHL